MLKFANGKMTHINAVYLLVEGNFVCIWNMLTWQLSIVSYTFIAIKSQANIKRILAAFMWQLE